MNSTDAESETIVDTKARTIAGESKTRRLIPIVLAALVLASAVAVALLGWQAIRAADAERTEAEALDTARISTGQVLSFDSKTIDADLARARALVSGAFAAQFDQRVNEVIMPAIRQQAITTKAEVVRSALIDARPERVEALLFVDQTTTSSTNPAPQRTPVQVRVTMTNVDGRWLISELQPLG